MFKNTLKFKRWVFDYDKLAHQLRKALPSIEDNYGVRVVEKSPYIFSVSGKGAEGVIIVTHGEVQVDLTLSPPASLFRKKIEGRLNEIIDSVK